MSKLPELSIELPMSTVSMTSQRPENQINRAPARLKGEAMARLLCVLTSATALSVMITAKQASSISIYGFTLPLYSKWSFSDSFNYLVGVSAAVATHSLLQLMIVAFRIMRKSTVVSSRNRAWFVFAGDQILAYAMMSAGSAASGVTNLNHTGIHHSTLPNFCKALDVFCNRVAVSIAFAFLSCFLLSVSVVLDVLRLSDLAHD